MYESYPKPVRVICMHKETCGLDGQHPTYDIHD